jgi:uncharacterized protein YoxC
MTSANTQAIEFINTLKNGFNESVQIHFESNNEEDITLEKLFKAINSLPTDSIEPFYEHIRTTCSRDTNAIEKWASTKEQLSSEKSNQNELISMLKQHNRTYYDEKLDHY